MHAFENSIKHVYVSKQPFGTMEPSYLVGISQIHAAVWYPQLQGSWISLWLSQHNTFLLWLLQFKVWALLDTQSYLNQHHCGYNQDSTRLFEVTCAVGFILIVQSYSTINQVLADKVKKFMSKLLCSVVEWVTLHFALASGWPIWTPMCVGRMPFSSVRNSRPFQV